MSLRSCPNIEGSKESSSSQRWRLEFGFFHGQPPYLVFFFLSFLYFSSFFNFLLLLLPPSLLQLPPHKTPQQKTSHKNFKRELPLPLLFPLRCYNAIIVVVNCVAARPQHHRRGKATWAFDLHFPLMTKVDLGDSEVVASARVPQGH
jgi:hypothetical protein